MSVALAVEENDALLQDLRDVDRLFLTLDAENCRASLFHFLQGCWDIVEPSQPFVDNWHIREICTVLERITLGHEELLRWVFNIAPGTLKSLLISVIWPAWVWARDGNKKFLTASYGQHLTTRDNLRVRTIVESKWFQERFPLKLVDDQNTKTRYNTEKGGWRIATSVDGVGTGEHPDVIIIDDPTTAAQAESKADRNAANAWFDRTISSRGISKKRLVIIIVMQRLHMEDLTGHVVHREGWGHVRFPMRYEKCTCPLTPKNNTPALLPEDVRCPLHKADLDWQPDPRDPRTQPGELMVPQLIDEGKVKQLELDLGAYGTAGQLQQRPSPEGGGIFKREWFKFVDKAPSFMRKVRGWDTAGTEGGGDWTVGVLIGEEFETVVANGKTVTQSTGRFFVCDVAREQLGPANVDNLIHSTAMMDGKDTPVREEREGGSAGLAVIGARAKRLVGFDYAGVQVSGSKITRSKPFRAQCEAGNVFLVRAPWNQAYISELSNFPTGTHDDQVDGSSCSFNAVLLEPPPRKARVTW